MDEEEYSDPRSPPAVISMDRVLSTGEPAEHPAGMTTSTSLVQFQTRNPIWRLSPWHNGSTLYDSYELKAVTHQLNKAIQQASTSTAASSSPYVPHLKSPFCRQRLDSIYKQNTKTQRRISGGEAARDRNPSAGRARGFVTRLWKKLKQGFFRSKQKNECGSKVSIQQFPPSFL